METVEPAGTALRLGAHLSHAGGLVRAADRAGRIGANALQVFADNPTAWRRRGEPSPELEAFRERLAALDIRPVAIHAAYLINLAGPNPQLRERSIAVLRSELEVAPGYGARFVNVHVGSHLGTGVEAGVGRVAAAVARVLGEVEGGPGAATLVLENSAGGGGGVGATVTELAGILDAAAAHGVDPARLAICLDTAHLWGAGYRISEPAEVDTLLAEFDRRIGLGRLAMIHLNDSKAALGSRSDRHQHLGAGAIGVAGLGHLLRQPALAGVAWYLETPGMDDGYDAVNLARARDLAAGRPLQPLPPEPARRTRPERRGMAERRRPAADA